MASIKQKDFVEIEYTGRFKDDKKAFDTTDLAIAKKEGIMNENGVYGPVVICLGQHQLLAGLDEKLEGKEIGKSYSIALTAEEAFGKKDAKLIKMIPSSAFIKQKIMPEPGLQVNIDGMMGAIKTASGGRVLVDFNHPLSGKDVTYDVKLNRLVTDDAEKVKKFLELQFQLKDLKVAIEDKKAKVEVYSDVPEEVQKAVNEMIKEIIPSLAGLEFDVQKKEVKKDSKEEDAEKGHVHGPDCKHD